MDISYFSDTYIINEYLRLKQLLESMPRYKVGMHNGRQVIREYSGTGSETIRHISHMNSRSYEGMHQKTLAYTVLNKLSMQYKDEIKRRHLTIPENIELKSDYSVFNIDLWNSLTPCSNSLEIRTDLYDDFGFHVRSRGEMIIGNAVKDLGLEAKYETRFILKGGKKIYPDYTFPVHIINRCFFIEFIGMTENDDYINYNYGKIDEYMRNGILPGRDLILICGTNTWLPSQESMRQIIASFINTAVDQVYRQKN